MHYQALGLCFLQVDSTVNSLMIVDVAFEVLLSSWTLLPFQHLKGTLPLYHSCGTDTQYSKRNLSIVKIDVPFKSIKGRAFMEESKETIMKY